MKVVILAGGLGTRLSEETVLKPKPMVEIGQKPILWHIMKHYSWYGHNDFIICLGYKGYIIKEYFANYFLHTSDITMDLKNNKLDIHKSNTEPWKITLIDTGMHTMTGGRLKRVKEYIGNERFMMTYGDGVSNIDINKELQFHKDHGKLATIAAVQPSARFGALDISGDNSVNSFIEKPAGAASWINAGFFVLEPQVIDYIDDDSSSWERAPLERIAAQKGLQAFKHKGFWKPMDTLRDKRELESLWKSESAPWKVW